MKMSSPFRRRTKEQTKEQTKAKVALYLSSLDLEKIKKNNEEVSRLSSEARAIRKRNHFAEQLRYAMGGHT